MRLSFRLAKLVNYTPDRNKRPGIIKAIVEATGLDRHLVSNLLKNVARGIPLDAMSRLCEFLVDNGFCSPDQLPGALFGVEAETFWELLARRQRLELCVGVRSAEQPEWPERAWVVASDAVLLGELLNGVSTLGGTTQLRIPVSPGEASTEANAAATSTTTSTTPRGRTPHPEHLRQTLVWSPGPQTSDVATQRALEVYDEFGRSRQDKALVCLGSMKSNPVAELVMAEAFDAAPFKSLDGQSRAMDRKCPIYLRYRDHDPHPESCWGGTRLALDADSAVPGIYYEKEDGSWACCPSDETGRDVAFVSYVTCEAQGWIQMTLGGFSGRATRLLARTLASRAEEFWPPTCTVGGKQYGTFVVAYKLPPELNRQDVLRTDVTGDPEIIPISQAALERRLTADDADDREATS